MTRLRARAICKTVGIGLLLAIAMQADGQTLTERTGWDGAPIHFPNAGTGTAETRTYAGEVGDEGIVLFGPGGMCSAGSWTARDRLVSGSLPPGMELDIPGNILSGIAKESGRWAVELEEDQVDCGGVQFPGFRQTLIFEVRSKKGGETVGKP